MAEYLLDDDPVQTQWVVPDEKGFTLRTRYKGTQGILDQNARERTGKHERIATPGSQPLPAVRMPLELYEQITIAMGREPTADEMIAIAETPEYKMLKLTDKRLI